MDKKYIFFAIMSILALLLVSGCSTDAQVQKKLDDQAAANKIATDKIVADINAKIDSANAQTATQVKAVSDLQDQLKAQSEQQAKLEADKAALATKAKELEAALNASKVSTPETTSKVEGYQISQGANILEINEKLSSVKSLLDKSVLKELTSSQLTTSKGTYDYNQYLALFDAKVVYEKNTAGLPEDSSDAPVWALKFPKGKAVYEYQLKFTTQAESSIVDSHLKDIENKKITLFNKEYTISSAVKSGNALTLTLMGGSVSDSLAEGQSKTYIVNGKDYTVEVVTVDSNSKVLFKLNGELLDTVTIGDTVKGAIELSVKDVLVQNFAEGKRLVSFYLGADKLVLKDSDVTDGSYSSTEIRYNDKSVYDTDVRIDATTSDPYKINALFIKYVPNDDYYLTAGKQLSEVLDNGQLFNGFDMQFAGINVGNSELIQLVPSGDNQYNLDFTNYAGEDVRIPYVYLNGASLQLGSSSDALVLKEGVAVNKNDFFLVSTETNNNDNSRSGYTSLLRYKGCSVSSLICSFRNEGTGDTIEVPFANTENAVASLIVNGNTYKFAFNGTQLDSSLFVDATNHGYTTYSAIVGANSIVPIYTKYGAEIDFTGASLTSFVLKTEKSQSATAVDSFKFDITTSGSTMDVSNPILQSGSYGSDEAGLQSVGSSDNSEASSQYGLFIEKNKDANSPDRYNFKYPDEQVEAFVVVQ